MLRGLVTAVRTLTVLPFPGRDAGNPADSLPWFPLVGAALGAALYGAARLCGMLPDDGRPELAGLAVALGGAMLTRGLHLDGLADWADGFGGGRDRESTLAIMKDPHTGAFGVIAVAGALLAKFAAAARLADSGTALWILAALVASRTVQVDLACAMPYARTEGGKAGPFVAGARPVHRVLAVVAALAVLAGALGPAGVLALAGALLIGRIFGAWCQRRVGGITGDLLGAASEIVETALLLACAAFGKSLAGLTGWTGYL